MTRSAFDAYMLAAACVAGFLGVANLLRPDRRWLGLGAILLGVGAMLYRQGAATPVYVVACVLAVFCLVKDAASRPHKTPGGKQT